MPKHCKMPYRALIVKTRVNEEERAKFSKCFSHFEISQSEFTYQAVHVAVICPTVTTSPVYDELLYGKNEKREDVKKRHSILGFDPRASPNHVLTVGWVRATGVKSCAEHYSVIRRSSARTLAESIVQAKSEHTSPSP